MKIKVGARGSKLAVKQAEIACQALSGIQPGLEMEIITISTKGDQNLEQPLYQIGGKGLFVKEIETALYDKTIDIAVHSMKDMPGELPEGLVLGGVLKREDARDALVTRAGTGFAALPKGAKVGTGSLRRQEQLMSLRPDLEFVPIRGNILTRLKKLEAELDGIVLAAAGLKRLSLDSYISQYFNTEEMVPAACQGIISLEIREEDTAVKELVNKVNHRQTFTCAMLERAFLNKIGADCHEPVGVYSTILDGKLHYSGFYRGMKILNQTAPLPSPEKAGEALAVEILEKGDWF